MVFSTAPVYHQDPPNWHLHLQQNLQQGNNNNPQSQTQQQQVLPPPPPAYHTGGGGGGDGVGTAGSIRPGSMSDRARLAKIPQPEAALKCPRCESTNTKFCYFNNYNLSQPRHFCKMCRRYWTRGGALRNVPVGGGCRRNKKSKSSKSKAGASNSTTSNNNTSTDPRHKITSSSSTSTDLGAAPRSDHEHDNYIMGHHNYYPQQPPQLPFLSSLQNLTHFGGLNLRGINPAQSSILSPDQWSGMQQFPFMAGGFEPSQAGAILGNNRGVAASSMPMMTSGAARVCDNQVKMEETLNSGKAAKLFLGMASDSNDQYYSSWGGGSSTWNNPIGSADDDEDNQMPGQQLNSSAATAHFL